MKAIKVRRDAGFTLTEMIVTAVLLGFSLVAIGEVAVMSTYATTKMNNKVDSLTAGRVAIDRVSKDVRAARCFGDFYVSSAMNKFPGDSTNPLYGTVTPAGGWPPAPWTTPPYQLSAQTLIVQQPVLFLDPVNDPSNVAYSSAAPINPRNGFPMMVRQGAISAGPPAVPSVNIENLDTVVYQVVPDPNMQGQFLLQMARFSGAQLPALAPESVTSSYKQLVNPPQTILKGIVGPKDVANAGNLTALPNVFRYYENPSTTAPPKLIPTNQLVSSKIPSIRGVAVDVEVLRPDSSTTTSTSAYPEIFGVHNETFMRANTNSSLTNF